MVTEVEMIRVLHENWPDSISQFRLKGIVGLATHISDHDIGNLRKAHVQTMVEVDDVVYVPLGGGVMTSGDSMQVVRATIDLRGICRELENVTREINGLNQVSGDDFSLTRDGNKAVVTNTRTGQRICERNWSLRTLE